MPRTFVVFHYDWHMRLCIVEELKRLYSNCNIIEFDTEHEFTMGLPELTNISAFIMGVSASYCHPAPSMPTPPPEYAATYGGYGAGFRSHRLIRQTAALTQSPVLFIEDIDMVRPEGTIVPDDSTFFLNYDFNNIGPVLKFRV